MERKIRTLTISYFAFLILLTLSGLLPGILYHLVYYSAFVLPFAFVLLLNRREDKTNYFTIDSEGVKLTILCLAPCVSIVLLISMVTSLIIYQISGATNDMDLGNSLVFALINYSLMPAILEEMLFRYLPMRLLASHSKKATVLISAFFFALVHHSLFSIPYAFAAGVIFMAINLMCGSVIPSILLHFINNAMSILMIFYPESPILPILLACGILSVIILLFGHFNLKKRLTDIFQSREKVGFTMEMLVFAVLMLGIAVISLSGGVNG